MIDAVLIRKRIIPKTVVVNRKTYPILEVDEELIHNEHIVLLVDDTLQGLILPSSMHPNCNTENKLFCLPDNLVSTLYDENIQRYIESILETHYLDSAYFMPWKWLSIDMDS